MRQFFYGLLFGSFLAAPGLLAATSTSNSVDNSPQASQKSGNATEEAAKQAAASRDAEIRNNVNTSSEENVKGGGESAIYPKSAAPDVQDSYASETKTQSIPGQEKKKTARKYHGNRTTGSSTLDSFSGSSRLPDDQQSTKSEGKNE